MFARFFSRAVFAVSALACFHAQAAAQFKDAADFGFLPQKSASENVAALQSAVDGGGTITVSKKGVYDVNDTVFLDSHTKLIFGSGVTLRKVPNPKKAFSYVFLNRGAPDKKWNCDIQIDGLSLSVNGVDFPSGRIFGLSGHVSFFYARDVKITRLRCEDLAPGQFCVHVCTFEDLLVDDIIVYGRKDGIHLGRGKRFRLSNGVFRTFDDAIALNAHDYSISNPELGWIEDGVVENMTDLDAEDTTGYFCRILAGSWTDWREGMEVQKSDTVVSGGRVYRVEAKPDGKKYLSKTRPTHLSGMKVLDGIKWYMVQEGAIYNAGVRNVVFRDIFLRKPRIAFSVHFDDDVWSRSYYPGAPFVGQENLVFDNVHVEYEKLVPFISSRTPINALVLRNCFLRNSPIQIRPLARMGDKSETAVKMIGCTIAPTCDYAFFSASSGKPVVFESAATNVKGGRKLGIEADMSVSKVKSDFANPKGGK